MLSDYPNNFESRAILILLAFSNLYVPSNSNIDSTKMHDLSASKTTKRTEEDEGRGVQWVEAILWQPRAAIYHNLLSKQECEHLINLAKPHMQKSVVVDGKSGMGKESSVRTSSSSSLPRGRDEIIQNIEERSAKFTFIPVEKGEAFQVLHYDVGQKYDLHCDYFTDGFNPRNGGNRMATLLMYLSDVEKGGETVFPAARGNFLAKCGNQGLSVKPKMGDALLFWNMKPEGFANMSTPRLHSFLSYILGMFVQSFYLSCPGSCPVIKGNKWVATKWMPVNEYKLDS
ncbi:hypothetical protein SLA2020_134970 [Shorea laevis]